MTCFPLTPLCQSVGMRHMHRSAVPQRSNCFLSPACTLYQTCDRLRPLTQCLMINRAAMAGTNMYFGSGIVSIIGPAFAYIPVITASLGKMMAEGQSFDHAWGRMAGTIMAVAPIQARALQTILGTHIVGASYELEHRVQ